MKKEMIILTEEQRTKFEVFLWLCKYYRNSYFWGNMGNAYHRRRIEKNDYLDYQTEVNGVEYDIHFSVSLSCRHVYVTKYIYRDGIKTNARVIRTLLEKSASTQSA